jgi:hypothetical protein
MDEEHKIDVLDLSFHCLSLIHRATTDGTITKILRTKIVTLRINQNLNLSVLVDFRNLEHI